jgi:5-methyltetrahydropteroyltriglutamate--homocysteine methyltransferase
MNSSPTPPFRADHVGSLLRPEALLAARAEHDAGRSSGETLRRAEDDAIGEAVRLQHAVGLTGITDGEFRRGSWHMDFLYQIGGVAKTDRRLNIQFKNEAGTIEFSPAAHRVGDRLRLDKTIFGDDFSYLKSVAPLGTTPKLTIPSPSMLHYRGGRAAISETAYPEMDAFWHDLAEVYKKEIAGLAALGCTYLQLDDTSLAYLNDPAQRAYVTGIGGDGATQHLTNIRLINQALADKPAGMTVCTHMCRGNFRSSWMAKGATTMSPRRCSANWRSMLSFSNTTMRARAVSRRCVSCRGATSGSCSAWSPPSARRSRPRTTSSAASTRRPDTCRSNSFASARNAASPRPSTATR